MQERWSVWLIGVLLGAVGTVFYVALGSLMLALTLAVVAAAAAEARSVALLSGTLIGAGLTYIGLLIQADLACQAAALGVNQGCQAPDLAPYWPAWPGPGLGRGPSPPSNRYAGQPTCQMSVVVALTRSGGRLAMQLSVNRVIDDARRGV